MIRRILKLLLPTVIYVWIYVTSDGNFLGWQDAKKVAKEVGQIADPVPLFERIAAWAIVLCASYVAAHVIHAIVQGRLP